MVTFGFCELRDEKNLMKCEAGTEFFDHRGQYLFGKVRHEPSKNVTFLTEGGIKMPETENSTISTKMQGFLRLNQVLELIPVGRTRWYEGVKNGEFPQPVALGARLKLYRWSDINELMERISSGTFSPA